MKRTTLSRRTRLRAVSKRRAAKRRRRNVYGPKHRWHADQPCWCDLQGFGHECMGDRCGHHDPSVEHGGNDDREATLCWMHHTGPLGIHQTPKSEWEAKYGPMDSAVRHFATQWESRDGRQEQDRVDRCNVEPGGGVYEGQRWVR